MNGGHSLSSLVVLACSFHVGSWGVSTSVGLTCGEVWGENNCFLPKQSALYGVYNKVSINNLVQGLNNFLLVCCKLVFLF